MNAHSTATADHSPATSTPVRPLTMSTRLAIELRKLVDTRSALVLLGVTAALTMFFTLAVPVMLGEALTVDRVAGELGAFPLIYLLPIVGLLTAASEWRHGTALWTYALDPHRSSVLLAKLVAVLLVTVIAALVTLALSFVGSPLSGAAVADTGDLTTVAGRLLLGLLGFALVGFGLGAALLNPALAICLFLIAPQVLPQLLSLSQTTAALVPWMDINHVLMGVLGGAPAGEPAQVISTLTLWIVIPLAIGFWRNARRSA